MTTSRRRLTAGRLTRWAFFDGLNIGAEGDPYLDRLRIIQTPWFGVYLHHIHRPDSDPDPHDHPWAFASLVLTGSYRELVWPDKHQRDQWVTRDRHRSAELAEVFARQEADMARYVGEFAELMGLRVELVAQVVALVALWEGENVA